MRPVLFRTVYYAFLPVGHAQAWLAETFRRTGMGLGWPLLLAWWPLRQLYVAGFRLCVALVPEASNASMPSR